MNHETTAQCYSLDDPYLITRLLSVLWCALLTPGPGLAQLPGYGESDLQPGYGQEEAAASAPMSGMDMLRMSVPGNPGQVRRGKRQEGAGIVMGCENYPYCS